MKKLGLLLLVVALIGVPMTASAASPWAEEMTYKDKTAGKFMYGLTNTALGWTSLFRTPQQAYQNGDNVFLGIGQGLFNAVGQTVVGAAHLVTFPIPQIDIPAPQGGTDILG